MSEKLQGKLLDLSTLKLSQGIFEVEDTKLLHFSLKFLNLFLFREKTDECWEYIKVPQLMYLSFCDHLEKLWSNLLADDCCLDHNGSLVLEYILEFLCVWFNKVTLIHERKIVHWMLPLLEVFADCDSELRIHGTTFQLRRFV